MIEVEALVNTQASETQSTYRRWVGVMLSLLIPGLGIYLAGDRRTGLRWFCGLTALGFASEVLTPLPGIPGISAFVITACSGLALTCWMLVRSFRSIPIIRATKWLVLIALACALWGTEWIFGQQLGKAFRHPTNSMIPTLVPGDRLIVQASAYWFAQPRRGDIVVFRTDCKASLPKGEFWVKRIAALPGEFIHIQQGHLAIDGKRLVAPAVLATNSFFSPSRWLLPDETISFLMPRDYVVGDNVTDSRDSRDFGPIPRRSIVGKVTKIYWPLSRIGDVK